MFENYVLCVRFLWRKYGKSEMYGDSAESDTSF